MGKSIKLPLEQSFAALCAKVRAIGKAVKDTDDAVTALASTVGDALDGKADKAAKVSVSIAASAWKSNTDTASKNAGYLYYADAAVSGLTVNDAVKVNLDFASLSVAKACGMAQSCVTSTNRVRFFAVSVPSAALTATVYFVQGKS